MVDEAMLDSTADRFGVKSCDIGSEMVGCLIGEIFRFIVFAICGCRLSVGEGCGLIDGRMVRSRVGRRVSWAAD